MYKIWIIILILIAVVVMGIFLNISHDQNIPKIGKGEISTLQQKYKRFYSMNTMNKIIRNSPNNYELGNILERYSITAYPRLKTQRSIEILKRELKEKHSSNLYTRLIKALNIQPEEQTPTLILKHENNTVIIKYGEFEMKIPSYRYDILKQYGTDNEILECAVEYASFLPKSQQWAIPLEEYKKFVEHGATIEGFASPFNSQIIRISPDLKYCSLSEYDKKFGSLGNFFDQDFGNKIVIVNPPFIEDILEKASRKCINELDKHKSKFIFYGPAWSDSAFYKLLSESKYKTSQTTLYKNTYYYEDLLNDQKIPARFNSVVFTLERL
ncbi:MAG: hypothetical protein E6R13_09255 [Spirochaetes bacterium]|nr:MAG: hypothetical protein E6R13_09255 [Spirochaetota bacterium]